MPDPIPESARRFLIANVDSLTLLDSIALLRGDRSRTWSVDDLVRQLKSTHRVVRLSLAKLSSLGLVDVDLGHTAKYGYSPGSAEEESILDVLLETYRVDPDAVARILRGGAAAPRRS